MPDGRALGQFTQRCSGNASLLKRFYQLQLFVVDFTFTQHSVQHQDGKVQGLLAQPQVMLYLEYRGTGFLGTAAGDAVP